MNNLELNINKWGKFRVGDIFTFIRGKGITTDDFGENNGDIPCIQGGENNNGVLGFLSSDYKNDRNFKYVKAPFLSLARVGTSGLVCFQDMDCFIGDKAFALIAKINIDKYVYLFLSTILNGLKYKYFYGKGITIKKYLNEIIKLPIDNQGKPDWQFMEHYIKNIYEPIHKKIETKINNKKIELNVERWKKFNLSELFRVKRGKRLTKENRITGNIPFVTAGYQNDGITEYIDNDGLDEYQNALTIDMFCNCFYRNYKFSCDDNILVLKPNFEFNIFILLFFATVISFNKYRYFYGKQYRKKDFNEHIIKLPVDNQGNPDWQFMEDYIKQLPYSDVI